MLGAVWIFGRCGACSGRVDLLQAVWSFKKKRLPSGSLSFKIALSN